MYWSDSAAKLVAAQGKGGLSRSLKGTTPRQNSGAAVTAPGRGLGRATPADRRHPVEFSF
jgi:hypothetical protein